MLWWIQDSPPEASKRHNNGGLICACLSANAQHTLLNTRVTQMFLRRIFIEHITKIFRSIPLYSPREMWLRHRKLLFHITISRPTLQKIYWHIGLFSYTGLSAVIIYPSLFFHLSINGLSGCKAWWSKHCNGSVWSHTCQYDTGCFTDLLHLVSLLQVNSFLSPTESWVSWNSSSNFYVYL